MFNGFECFLLRKTSVSKNENMLKLWCFQNLQTTLVWNMHSKNVAVIASSLGGGDPIMFNSQYFSSKIYSGS